VARESVNRETDLVNSLRGVTIVPRVDSNTASESAIAVASRELPSSQAWTPKHINESKTYLTQNESTILPILALDELVGSQSHTFSQTRNNERVAHSQQSEILAEREILGMQKDNGLIGESREPRVDVRNDVSYATGKFVGFRGLKSNLD
jgi:hypothetical protein